MFIGRAFGALNIFDHRVIEGLDIAVLQRQAHHQTGHGFVHGVRAEHFVPAVPVPIGFVRDLTFVQNHECGGVVGGGKLLCGFDGVRINGRLFGGRKKLFPILRADDFFIGLIPGHGRLKDVFRQIEIAPPKQFLVCRNRIELAQLLAGGDIVQYAVDECIGHKGFFPVKIETAGAYNHQLL